MFNVLIAAGQKKKKELGPEIYVQILVSSSSTSRASVYKGYYPLSQSLSVNLPLWILTLRVWRWVWAHCPALTCAHLLEHWGYPG